MMIRCQLGLQDSEKEALTRDKGRRPKAQRDKNHRADCVPRVRGSQEGEMSMSRLRRAEVGGSSGREHMSQTGQTGLCLNAAR